MKTVFRCAALVLVLLVLMPLSAEAQFGKNVVIYDPADWYQVESEHFTIYLAKNHFASDEDLYMWGAKIKQMVERAYGTNVRFWGIELSERPGLVIFADQTKFERTHMTPGLLPEGVGAFADPDGLNIALPLGRPIEEVEAVLTHEVTHIFEFDYFWSNQLSRIFSSRAPGWIMEGLANKVPGRGSSLDRQLVASMILHQDMIPTVQQLTRAGGYLADYVLGKVMWDYIEDVYGREKLSAYLVALRQSATWDLLEPIPRVFDVGDVEEFDEGFRQYLRNQYLDRLLTKQDIDEIATPLMDPKLAFPKRYAPSGTAESLLFFSSIASPDGQFVAGFVINRERGRIEVVLVSAKDGSFVRSLTEGHSYVSDYQYPIAQQLTIGPEVGADLAFSPDGRFIAFFGRIEPNRVLVVVDIETGDIVQRRRMKGFSASPLNPSFSPDGRQIVFSGTKDLQRDIWLWDRESDALRLVTDDRSWDFAPVWMSDDTIVYISVVEQYTKVFTKRVDSDEDRSQRTFGETNETFAIPSSAGELLIVSDRNDIFNLYFLDLDQGTMTQVTDLPVGVVYSSVQPGGENQEIIVGITNASGVRPYRIDVIEPISQGTARGFAPSIVPDRTLTPVLAPDEITPAKKRYEFKMGPIFGGYQSGLGYNVLADFSFSFVERPFLDRAHIGRVLSYGPFRLLDYTFLNRHSRFLWGLRASHFRLQGLTFDPFTGQIDSRISFGSDNLSFIGHYPLSLWRRLEVEVGWQRRIFGFIPPSLESRFRSGSYMYLRTSFVSDTVRYAWFGPYEGAQFRGDIENGFPPGGLQFTDFTFEVRRYFPITSESLIAMRFWGFASIGRDPTVRFFGGWDQVRGVDPWSFSGDRGMYANVEYRFLFIADSPIGPVRMRVFVDIADAAFAGDASLIEELFRLRDKKVSAGFGPTFYFLPMSLYYDVFSKRVDVVLGYRW